MEDFFGNPIALGSIANLEQAASEAIAAPVEEVKKVFPSQPVVHADGTGWYERSQPAWLWVAAASSLAIFLVRKTRCSEVAKELLGATFAGILICRTHLDGRHDAAAAKAEGARLYSRVM